MRAPLDAFSFDFFGKYLLKRSVDLNGDEKSSPERGATPSPFRVPFIIPPKSPSLVPMRSPQSDRRTPTHAPRDSGWLDSVTGFLSNPTEEGSQSRDFINFSGMRVFLLLVIRNSSHRH